MSSHPLVDIHALYDIPIELVIELGRSSLTLRELAEVEEAQIIELDRLVTEPLQVYTSGRLIGEGEVVVEDGRVGLRLTRLFGRTALAESA